MHQQLPEKSLNMNEANDRYSAKADPFSTNTKTSESAVAEEEERPIKMTPKPYQNKESIKAEGKITKTIKDSDDNTVAQKYVKTNQNIATEDVEYEKYVN